MGTKHLDLELASPNDLLVYVALQRAILRDVVRYCELRGIALPPDGAPIAEYRKLVRK